MPRIIYVVYLVNPHINPTGIEAFFWENKARDFIMANKHLYRDELRIMLVTLND